MLHAIIVRCDGTGILMLILVLQQCGWYVAINMTSMIYMHTFIRVVFCIMRDYSTEANYHDVHKMVIATAMELSGWRISQIYIF